jgi:hypothetical protein
MLTKNDYIRAAAIIRKFAERGYSPNRMLSLYQPFKARPKCMNLTKEGNNNWTTLEVEMWEEAFNAHDKGLFTVSAETEVFNKKRTSNGQRNYFTVAANLEKKGGIVAMIQEIKKQDFAKGCRKPSDFALIFDFLFAAMEKDNEERHKRLVKIFAENPVCGKKGTDEVWVNILWDFRTFEAMRRISMSLTEKYYAKA